MLALTRNPKNWRAQAFTFAEILVTLTLLFVLLGLAVFKGAGSRQGSTRAAAERVAEELKRARNRAISLGEPVAFAIPSGESSTHFYLLEGQRNPRVVEERNIEVDHRGVRLSPAHWAGPSFEASSQLTIDSNSLDFEFETWNPPKPDDFIITFLPTGAVLSNKLAANDRYHFLITQGIQAPAASLDGVSSWSAIAVNKAFTLSVSTTGQVSVSQGVLGGSLVEDPSLSFTEFSPQTFAEGPNSAPSDLQIEVFPKPNANASALGVDATVDENGFLTLKATATDAQSDRLRCKWVCEEDAGAFSYDQEMEMEWNPKSGRWEAIWEWHPPNPDLLGEYTLGCTVTDGQGGEVSANIPVDGKVKVLHQGKIAFSSDETGNWEIYTCNTDGTDVANLTRSPNSEERFPHWTPDGRKIVYLSDRTGLRQIESVNSDGSERKQITTSPGGKYELGLSADGTKLTWVRFVGPGGAFQQIFTADFDGANEEMIYDSTGVFNTVSRPRYSLDKKTIFFSAGLSPQTDLSKYADTVNELWKIDLETRALEQLTNFPGRAVREPSISPIDGRLAFMSFGQGGKMIYTAEFDRDSGTFTVDEKSAQLAGLESPEWSPSVPGQVVVQERLNNGATRNLWIVDADSGQNIRQVRENPGGNRMDDSTWGAVVTAP